MVRRTYSKINSFILSPSLGNTVRDPLTNEGHQGEELKQFVGLHPVFKLQTGLLNGLEIQ